MTGTTLKITKKNFQDGELPHELFLTTRQRLYFSARNMLMDIKLSIRQLSKIIQLSGFLGKH